MTLEVRVFDRIDSVSTAAWDQVIAHAHAPVFYSRAFLRAYERSPLQSTRATYYLEVRERPQGRLLAVVPAYLQEIDDPAGDIASVVAAPARGSGLMLLSHVVHCYDSHLPAIALTPGLVSRVAAALGELAGQAGADFFGFLHVEADSVLARLLLLAGFTMVPMASRFRLGISRFTQMDDYVRALPSQQARRRLRHDRRVADEVRVTVTAGPGSAAALAGLAELCHRNAARHGTPAYYLPEQMLGFLSRLGTALQVIEVRLGEALIAAGACLRDQRRFHMWACGLDGQSHGRLASPYTVLFYESVRAAINAGSAVLEGGRGNDSFKSRFGFTPVRTLGAVMAL